MNYVNISAGIYRLLERLKMKIELTDEFDPELAFFTVDGREIEVPQEVHYHSKHPSNFTTHYIVKRAIDRETRKPVTPEIQAGLAKHIEQGCSKEGLKFKIVL